MKINKKTKKLKGYITLVIVILFVPFLLLQGINLVNSSVDIFHISTNSITSNKQYIDEQSCWEEIMHFFKKNTEIIGSREINTPTITCVFFVQDLGADKYKVTLETDKNSLYSFSERFVLYGSDSLQYITLQQEIVE